MMSTGSHLLGYREKHHGLLCLDITESNELKTNVLFFQWNIIKFDIKH